MWSWPSFIASRSENSSDFLAGAVNGICPRSFVSPGGTCSSTLSRTASGVIFNLASTSHATPAESCSRPSSRCSVPM
jgi:hypothetical protein